MSEHGIRISIIVATKDRYDTLFDCIDSLLLNYDCADVEIIVQDNSLRPKSEEFKARFGRRRNVLYNLNTKPVSQSENYEHGVGLARGEFVTMIGDDDGIAGGLHAIVDWMDRSLLDAFFPGFAKYRWPGVTIRLGASNPDGWLNMGIWSAPHLTDPASERLAVLSKGSTTLGKLPRLYYGLVRRRCLDWVRNKTGACFPGPSPDMANAFALSYAVNRMAVATLPLFISGNSRQSNAGLGLLGKHIGEIPDISFLPRDTTDRWNLLIPYFWSGPTIWSQSAFAAASAIGCMREFDAANNYSALYARVIVFHPRYVLRLLPVFSEYRRRYGISRVSLEATRTIFISIGLFASRVLGFFYRRIQSPIALFYAGGLPSITDATKRIDAAISDIDLGAWLDQGADGVSKEMSFELI